MDKKMMIGIGVVVVLIIIAIFAFSGGNKDSSSSSSSASSSSSSSASVSSEEQKYAEFEAELTCELLGATGADDIMDTMAKTAEVMEKYGYDDAEYNRLKSKYGNDNDFKALIISEIEDRCPDLVDQVSP